MFDAIGAVVVSVLPRRWWSRFPGLPLQTMVPVSGVLTILAGAALGIRGFFAYLARMSNAPAASILELSRLQVEGQLPETAAVSSVPAAMWAVAPVAFAFFTPIGLSAIYLVTSGWFRAASWWVDSPHGDPLLTGIDALIQRARHRSAARQVRQNRERDEGADEPDRRYPGAWADLAGIDFVIVAARRKAGWTPGTFVMTDEGWFTLGEPFDRPTPNGLRTIYPLTELQTLEVLRKGVPYQLPPLRPYTPRPARPGG